MELSLEISQFIFERDDLELYSHRTTSEDVAKSILREGFRYTESFQKTTDEIMNDLVYLRYWDSLRKHYGNIVVIIAFSKELIAEIRKKLSSHYEVHQALSKIVLEEEDMSIGDATFLLPTFFVKGFIHRETGAIHVNPDFNPDFVPEDLAERIAFLNTH